jgi:hypothetical protein
MNFAFHTSKVSLTWYKILQHGASSFTSPQKEGVLRIFIALTNPAPSSRFEPSNLRSNGKNANHYTAKDDSVFTVTINI